MPGTVSSIWMSKPVALALRLALVQGSLTREEVKELVNAASLGAAKKFCANTDCGSGVRCNRVVSCSLKDSSSLPETVEAIYARGGTTDFEFDEIACTNEARDSSKAPSCFPDHTGSIQAILSLSKKMEQWGKSRDSLSGSPNACPVGEEPIIRSSSRGSTASHESGASNATQVSGASGASAQRDSSGDGSSDFPFLKELFSTGALATAAGSMALVQVLLHMDLINHKEFNKSYFKMLLAQQIGVPVAGALLSAAWTSFRKADLNVDLAAKHKALSDAVGPKAASAVLKPAELALRLHRAVRLPKGKKVGADISLTALLQTAKESLDENEAYYEDDQRKALRQLIDQGDRLLKAYQEKKTKDLNAALSIDSKVQAKVSAHGLMTAADNAFKGHQPTLADLEQEEELRNLFTNLERVLSFPVRPKKLNPTEVAERCEEMLASRTPAFREKLKSMAQMLATGSNEENFTRELHYWYGEPGNGKTTGIQLLTKCAGVPLCLIDENTISAAARELPPQQTGGQPVINLSTYSSSTAVSSPRPMAEILEGLVAECLKTKFYDEKEGRTVTNGVILFDDIDRLPDADLKATMQFFKKLGDNAQKTVVDPKTKYPMSISRITAFATGNSVPEQMGKTDPALMSRIKKYAVPYSTEVERRLLVNDKYADFKADKVPQIQAPNFVLNEAACQATLGKILQFDLDHYQQNQQRTGMRGLENLLIAFFGHVLSRAESKSLAAEAGEPCADFSVEEAALSIGDYIKSPTEALIQEDFETEVRLFQSKNSTSIRSISSVPIRKFINESLTFALGNDPATQAIRANIAKIPPGSTPGYPGQPNITLPTLKQKQEAFTEAQQVLQFALGRKDFTGAAPAIKEKYSQKFAYLKRDANQYRTLSAVANSVTLKLMQQAKRNPVVLVKKEDEFGDLGVIRALANLFEVPLCEITDPAYVANKKPSGWMQYQTSKVRGDSFYHNVPSYGGYTFNYIPEKQVYTASNGSKVFIFDPEKGDSVEIDGAELLKPIVKAKRWIDYCAEEWKDARYPGQGFVVFNLPGLEKAELDRVVEDLSKEINSPGEEGKKGELMRDLRQISTFVVAKNGKAAQEFLDGPLKDKVLSLPVNTLSAEGRGEMARSMMADILTALSAQVGHSVALNDEEEKLFEFVVSWDRARAAEVKGKLSITPLRAAIDFVRSEVVSREENVLDIEIARVKRMELVQNLEKLYFDHMPKEVSAKFGARRSEFEKSQSARPRIQRSMSLDALLAQLPKPKDDVKYSDADFDLKLGTAKTLRRAESFYTPPKGYAKKTKEELSSLKEQVDATSVVTHLKKRIQEISKLLEASAPELKSLTTAETEKHAAVDLVEEELRNADLLRLQRQSEVVVASENARQKQDLLDGSIKGKGRVGEPAVESGGADAESKTRGKAANTFRFTPALVKVAQDSLKEVESQILVIRSKLVVKQKEWRGIEEKANQAKKIERERKAELERLKGELKRHMDAVKVGEAIKGLQNLDAPGQ